MDINRRLKQFNTWWDEFILEAVKPLSIMSMGLGTIAVFNLQGLAIQPWFVTSWAIVQAMSIDGLFFATWDRLFVTRRSWAMVGLAIVGIVLALVAIAINAILGYQVLWAIADSQQAMSRLGISSSLFTDVRAVLAVVVFIMISYVRSRINAAKSAPINAAPSVVAIAEETHTIPASRSHSNAAIVVADSPPQKAIPEQSSLAHSPLLEDSHSPKIVTRSLGSVALEKSTSASGDGYVAMEEKTNTHHRMAIVATGSQGYRDTIKAIWLRHMEEGRDVKLTEIASEAGIGYSTVKKWAPSIREEIEQSTNIGQSPAAQ